MQTPDSRVDPTVLALISLLILGAIGVVGSRLLQTSTTRPAPIPAASVASLPSASLQASPIPTPGLAAEQIRVDGEYILRWVTTTYGYSRFISPLDSGGQALFLPEAAWNQLPAKGQQALIQYAQQRGCTAIIVGQQTAPNTITLDKSVWQR